MQAGNLIRFGGRISEFYFVIRISIMNLHEVYKKQVVPSLKEKFGYTNSLAVPRLEKIVVNVGTGKNYRDDKVLSEIKSSVAVITGQKPVETFARKDISGFKIRMGTVNGLKVTLRGKRMYDFFERLVKLAFPRTRDFKGIATTSLDGKGNVNIGIKEHVVFPEIGSEEVRTIFGLEITIVTTAKNNEQALELLRTMGFPWQHTASKN